MKVFYIKYETDAYVLAENEEEVSAVLKRNVRNVHKITYVDTFTEHAMHDGGIQLIQAISETGKDKFQ